MGGRLETVLAKARDQHVQVLICSVSGHDRKNKYCGVLRFAFRQHSDVLLGTVLDSPAFSYSCFG